MNLVPNKHRLLIEVDVVEEKTAGGILLTTSVKESEQNQQVWATVKAIGATAIVDDQVRIGSRVLISKWGGYSIPGSTTVKLVADEDICAYEVADE
jgi:co-chaperonin GroES (HSP10)